MIRKKITLLLLSSTITTCLFITFSMSSGRSVSYLRQILTRGTHVLFTPQDNIKRTIIELIDKESKSIDVAIYYFTDPQIASAMQQAHKRGVNVTVVTEPKHLEECKQTQIWELYRTGSKIKVFPRTNGLMHHKFIVFGQNDDNNSIITAGSYNLTISAQRRNQEHIIVSNEDHIVNKYKKQFKYLKNKALSLEEFTARMRST